MKVVSRAEIQEALDGEAALAAIEAAFRALYQRKAQVMAVGHLAFTDPPGECHVKGAHIAGDDLFVIKLSSGFYDNSLRGLPPGNGFMAVISAVTGEVLALLHDEGWLTDQRTAMAGGIAARAIARPGSRTLGIVGAGIQARLQGRLIAQLLDLDTVLVWARNPDRADTLARALGGTATGLEEICAQADLIVTATPSTTPLLTSDMVGPGARIVAVGADSPGKQELETALTARSRIVVDSVSQCIDHGETGWAVRAGLVDPSNLIELGGLLTTPDAFDEAEIVVADLTGVAIQDVAIAKSVWLALQRRD